MPPSNRTAVERINSGLTLDHALRQALDRNAARTAVIDPDAYSSYSQLKDIAHRVCYYLEGIVDPSCRVVGLSAPANADSIGAILGIVLSGRAYMPLDPQAPAVARQRTLDVAGATVVLDAPSIALLPACPEKPSTFPPTDDGTPAAILYTSATTGAPKGIVISRRCALFHALTYAHHMRITDKDRVSLFSPLHVGASLSNLFAALVSGAAVCPMSLKRMGLDGMQDAISRHGLTVLHMVPSLFRRLVRDRSMPGAWRLVHHLKLGGETITGQDAALVRSSGLSGIHLMNGLGITEAGGNVTFGEIPADLSPQTSAPLGPMVEGIQARLLPVDGADDNEGELVIRSRFLASGFINAILSSDFTRHDDGTVSLCTGDLVRAEPDGTWTHAGRMDDIVKVNGVRIALPEVASALRSLPGIDDAAVVPVPDDKGRLRLHAFFTAPESLSLSALRSGLADTLPPAMIPAFFRHVESIQYGSGGKLNRRAMQQVAEAEPQRIAPASAPRDALEIKLLALWNDILRTHSPGIDDNFFDAGGDSLLGAKLLTRIYDECEARISLDRLYRYPSVAGIAAIIRDGVWNDTKQPCIVMKPGAPETRLFIFPGAGSDIVLLCDLAGSFKDEVTIIGCQYPGLDGKSHYMRTVPELGSFFLKHLRAIQPVGPYSLAGISFGGAVAFETARQLEHAGESVNFLGLLDTYAPGYLSFKRHLALPLKIKAFQYWCLPNGKKQAWTMKNACVGLCQKIGLVLERLRWTLLRRPSPYARRFRGLRAACFGAWKIYSILPVKAPVTVFRAEQPLPDDLFEQDSCHGWKHASTSRVDVIIVPGRHHTIMHHPHAAVLADRITREIHTTMP